MRAGCGECVVQRRADAALIRPIRDGEAVRAGCGECVVQRRAEAALIRPIRERRTIFTKRTILRTISFSAAGVIMKMTCT